MLILVLALIVFGPRRLPEIGKQLGKAMADFRRASMDIKSTVENEIRKIGEDEVRRVGQEKEKKALEPGETKPDDGAA